MDRLSFRSQVTDLANFVSARDDEQQAERARLQAKYARWRKYAARAKDGEMEDGACKQLLDAMVPGKGYRWGDLATLTGFGKGKLGSAIRKLTEANALHLDHDLRTTLYFRNLAD